MGPGPWWAALAELFATAQAAAFPEWQPGEPLALVSLLRHGATAGPDTPFDAEPLLRTGVDGITWSALQAETESGYLIVMTAPWAGVSPNLVVGESMFELLCLGCVCGYWALDALVEDANAELSAADDDECGEALAQLRSLLALSPWPDVPGRLAELERRHGRPAGRVPRDEVAYAEGGAQSLTLLEQMKAAFGRE
jgi:hypothetical protein